MAQKENQQYLLSVSLDLLKNNVSNVVRIDFSSLTIYSGDIISIII